MGCMWVSRGREARDMGLTKHRSGASLKQAAHTRGGREVEPLGLTKEPCCLMEKVRRAGERGWGQADADWRAHLLKEVAASRIELGVAYRDPSRILAVGCFLGHGSHSGPDGFGLVGAFRPPLALEVDSVGTIQHDVNP
jgi:hypothetical protein